MSSAAKPGSEHHVEESWNLPSDFDLYSKYQIRSVYLPRKKRKIPSSLSNCSSNTSSDNGKHNQAQTSNDIFPPYFNIECIDPTSPLDILNKSTSLEQYDATGHCVWTGAFLFIACMDQITDLVKDNYENGDTFQKDVMADNVKISNHLQKQMQIIELGCGTGIAGLSMMVSSFNSSNPSSKDHIKNIPSHPMCCCFTDEDPAVLKVCKRNCQLNGLIEGESYSIQELRWGDEDNTFIQQRKGTFDIVLATDVLYDIDLLCPLLDTVSLLLRQEKNGENIIYDNLEISTEGMDYNAENKSKDGLFILSHVPRACYNDNNPPEAIEDLEKYIIDQARYKHGMELVKLIKPPSSSELEQQFIDQDEDSDVSPLIFDIGVDSFAGSGIFVFKISKEMLN